MSGRRRRTGPWIGADLSARQVHVEAETAAARRPLGRRRWRGCVRGPRHRGVGEPVAQRALGQLRQGLAEHVLGERGQLGGKAESGALQQRTDGGPTQAGPGQGRWRPRVMTRRITCARRSLQTESWIAYQNNTRWPPPCDARQPGLSHSGGPDADPAAAASRHGASLAGKLEGTPWGGRARREPPPTAVDDACRDVSGRTPDSNCLVRQSWVLVGLFSERALARL